MRYEAHRFFAVNRRGNPIFRGEGREREQSKRGNCGKRTGTPAHWGQWLPE
jgi:hypothetical protein